MRRPSWASWGRAPLVAALAMVCTLGGVAYAEVGRHALRANPAGHAVTATRPSPGRQQAERAACARPAPSTAAGYTAMFAGLDTAQWGGADIAISVPLPDGRDVWLFGDTFSTSRFVHSTAVVQSGGCLHVSHGGAQLLPNAGPSRIYWISAARPAPDGLLITAREIALLGTGAWDFRDTGYERTARATVSVAGDVSFAGWTERRRSAPPDPGPMLRIDATHSHHFGYGRRLHPEEHLADGRVLVTTCQNWDDGVLHPFSSYRPLFSATPREAGTRT